MVPLHGYLLFACAAVCMHETDRIVAGHLKGSLVQSQNTGNRSIPVPGRLTGASQVKTLGNKTFTMPFASANANLSKVYLAASGHLCKKCLN